ncbi:cyclin-D3-2-like [Rhodamnia argentea]|uniref:Cyclin-D3-2-like n=1 Tax=Rhodamnia argentea TaxID=178133 RepID=A0A8B8QIV4_9MYRT|nr:cyclin-D3-2-like [Rhodamnia argentea]
MCDSPNLRCSEQHWFMEEQTKEQSDQESSPCWHDRFMKQEKLEEEEEEEDGLELQSLLSREEQAHSAQLFCIYREHLQEGSALDRARREAIKWTHRVCRHYAFSCTTEILSVDYYDRLLANIRVAEMKPWMVQLVAVACLSLAAKVNEIHVPTLSALQVEGPSYKFEPKTVQRMELLVLSKLEWRMNSVTPFSFLNHIIGRLHFHTSSQMDQFLTLFELSLLALVSDSRFLHHRPSVIAAVVTCRSMEKMRYEDGQIGRYRNALCNSLKWSEAGGTFEECYELVSELQFKSAHLNCHRTIEA